MTPERIAKLRKSADLLCDFGRAHAADLLNECLDEIEQLQRDVHAANAAINRMAKGA